MEDRITIFLLVSRYFYFCCFYLVNPLKCWKQVNTKPLHKQISKDVKHFVHDKYGAIFFCVILLYNNLKIP